MDIDNRGIKHLCSNCGTKFYDLNKQEIFCPKCNTKIDNKKEYSEEKKQLQKAVEKKESLDVDDGILEDEMSFEEDIDDEDEHVVDINKEGP